MTTKLCVAFGRCLSIYQLESVHGSFTEEVLLAVFYCLSHNFYDQI